MSQIFTIHDSKSCEICKEKMIETKVSEFKCIGCGLVDDSG
jgi:predicted RNA-binding Zn-ribbon protein involved in translation (DUF1610 family)